MGSAEMMLSPIIAAIRERCPSFANRVAGAADYDALEESTRVVVPAAFVVPMDDQADPVVNGSNDVRQALEDSFRVVVLLSNTADQRGQASYDQVHLIRAELWAGILGWEPDENHNPIEYRGSDLIARSRAFLIWGFDFSAATEITEEDAYRGTALDALPNLETVEINLDAVDPADANVTSPGPDGRSEAGATLTIPT
ncbi:phage tail terminator protein [Hwanghaeella sp.]|uniref:phage tail terminator protein n=1 Tax=Hwanghaeella sp. TaxID=2605943 RepID=UPI003CCBC838